MQCALIAWLTSLFYFDGYRISGTESLVYGAFMKDICSTYSCGCLFSWPLAFVGKLLPVPKMPFEEYFGRCFNCCGKRGILMFSVLFAMLRAWLLPVFPSGAVWLGSSMADTNSALQMTSSSRSSRRQARVLCHKWMDLEYRRILAGVTALSIIKITSLAIYIRRCVGLFYRMNHICFSSAKKTWFTLMPVMGG